ncbi:MAG TPA: cation:proton antiporter [Sedimentisphaerales bacterium]|nr:cation:proton antiporter [Sedimentisphaerales bacterium]
MVYSSVISSSDIFGHLNLTLLFGLVILGGTFGARLFQKFHIPQVVGCIVVGILLGDVLHLITPKTIDALEPFTMFALGLIGFMIGAELRAEVFKKYGRQFFVILFSQGMGAFLLVMVGGSVVVWFALPSLIENIGLAERLHTSLAMGLVLGAIASATAPAATANVLWEYKTRGPLTVAVLAIVALDDALALLLYRGAATGAKALMGTGQSPVLSTTLLLLAEIAGAIVLGFLAGVLLYYLLKFVRAEDKILEFAISCLLLVVGISMIPKIDPILPAMALGITIANLMPRQSKGTFELVKKFSPPIYTAFFVLAGAHMQFGNLGFWTIVMIVVYTICRVVGKMFGSWFGAKYSRAPLVVRKYLGICLLPQAGVAIGLAILAGQQFNTVLGHTIIMVVMTATFLMEILGPMLVKVGVKKAGEVGLNITEEDLIKTYKIADVMDTDPTSIPQDLPLEQILKVFSTSDSVYYPVIDGQSRIIGVITIPDIKEMFASREFAGWLLACDVAEPVRDKTTPNKPLEEAIEWMRRYNLENMPVVASGDSDELVGVLDYRKALRKISAEVLHRRRMADEMALATG